MTSFSFLDQHLELYPQKALYWEETSTLVVTDVHLGKAATFRAHGIPLPAGTTQENLNRLSHLIETTCPDRLLILGDLIHARTGRTREVIDQVTRWREALDQLTIHLILGNHDAHAGRPPDTWKMECLDESIEPPFVWRHHPGESDEGYVVAGHIHPAVSLKQGYESLRLPCFYFGVSYGLLPAFGEFTGFGVIRPRPTESVFVIADDEVLQVSPS